MVPEGADPLLFLFAFTRVGADLRDDEGVLAERTPSSVRLTARGRELGLTIPRSLLASADAQVQAVEGVLEVAERIEVVKKGLEQIRRVLGDEGYRVLVGIDEEDNTVLETIGGVVGDVVGEVREHFKRAREQGPNFKG